MIRTDNTAPGAPVALGITSANPNRYLSVFDAHFSLPGNQGSPITRVHYEIVDGAGKVVVPERVSAGVNPTTIPGITGPKAAGAYWLRVWLEDEVGLVGGGGNGGDTPRHDPARGPARPLDRRSVDHSIGSGLRRSLAQHH